MAKVFRLKATRTGRKLKKRFPPKTVSRIAPREWPPIAPIHGVMPDSKEEWWVYLALCRLRLECAFQKSVFGGKLVRGGQVIDFYVYTAPKPTILQVQGSYWHDRSANRERTRYNIEELRHYFGMSVMDIVEVWDYEIPDPETCFMVVRQKLRV